MSEQSKGYHWGGRILTGLSILTFAASGAMKLAGGADFLKQWASFGFKPELATAIGVVEVLCAVIYAIPQTSVLGAVLLTGYLGGAVVTHVRAGQPFIAPIAVGICVWGGIFLRDARVRALLPLRQP